MTLSPQHSAFGLALILALWTAPALAQTVMEMGEEDRGSCEALPAEPDFQRNAALLQGKPVCIQLGQVREADGRIYDYQLVFGSGGGAAPFWVLPHDHEDTAFDAGLRAVLTYGGGLIALEAGEKRFLHGQDTNRIFSLQEGTRCPGDKPPATDLTRQILDLLPPGAVLSLHTNDDGSGGERGTISALRNQRGTSGLAGHPSPVASGDLKDPDNAVLMAGLGALAKNPAVRADLEHFNAAGLHVIYEHVVPGESDCSLSQMLLLETDRQAYYNIEVEHEQLAAQTRMIAVLMERLGFPPLQ